MFIGNPDAPDEAKKELENLIDKLGWFKNMKAIYHIEKEYPEG